MYCSFNIKTKRCKKTDNHKENYPFCKLHKITKRCRRLVPKTLKWYKSYPILKMGWNKLKNEWLEKIGDKYGYIECGGGGDCQFHSIAKAFNLAGIQIEYKDKILKKLNYKILRKIAANKMSNRKTDNLYFKNILLSYQLENKKHNWNPKSIKNIKQFRKIIKTNGNLFWGDHFTLQLLSEALNTNFILMNPNGKFYNIADNFNKKYIVLILYYNQIHFQLIGYYNHTLNQMQTVFTKKTIPKRFLKYYMKNINQS